MDLAEYQKIKKELRADLKKARKKSDFQEVKACLSALVTLEEIKKDQVF